MVILKTNNESEKSIKDLVFSIEIIYVSIALLVFSVIYLFAEQICLYWIKANELPLDRLVKSIRFIGVLIAIQFPSSIYNGVMVSLGMQVSNSVMTIIVNVLKAVGVIAILKYFPR